MFCAAPRPVLDVPSVLYLPKTGHIAHRIGLHEVYMVVLKYVWPPHDVIRFKPSWFKPFKLNVGSCLAWSVAVRQTLFHGRSPSAALSPSLSTQVNSDWMKLNHEKWSYDPSQGFCLLCRWVVNYHKCPMYDRNGNVTLLWSIAGSLTRQISLHISI